MIVDALFASRSPAGRLDARAVCADLSVLATGAAVLVLFGISEVTLEHFGFHYIDTGGNPLTKFHPATYCAVAALALRCFASDHPMQTGWRMLGKSLGAVVLLAAVAVAMLSAVFITKTPVTGLIDSFVLPVLLFMLLRDLNRTYVRTIAVLLTGLLCINAAMAIYEFLRGVHFITLDVPVGATSDPTRGDATFDWRVQLAQEWRAVALLGHPLVNALIIGAFIICLAARGSRWMPGVVKVPILSLQLVAMFAFGARSSLVLGLFFASVVAIAQGISAMQRGERLSPRTIALVLFGAALMIGAVGILDSTGFFDRTLDRFLNDSGSAKARYTMFELFQPISWTDLLLGPDASVVATWQRIQGLEFGIESAWVGLVLTYGLIVTAIVMIGLAAFSGALVNTCGRGAAAVLAYFFISVSATASLSGKTTTLALTVVLILLFLHKDERQWPLRRLLDFRRR